LFAGIVELFPGSDLNSLKLTVITLKQKIPQNNPDADKITKTVRFWGKGKKGEEYVLPDNVLAYLW
jgi:hypothetical protein